MKSACCGCIDCTSSYRRYQAIVPVLAWVALSMPALSPVATECAQVFMQRVARVQVRQCPACGHGRMNTGADNGQTGCGRTTPWVRVCALRWHPVPGQHATVVT
jgi:hypothetical protein